MTSRYSDEFIFKTVSNTKSMRIEMTKENKKNPINSAENREQY